MWSMSILSAFKFKSNENTKPTELENAAIVTKNTEISTAKTDSSGQEQKKPSPCCCCKETKQKRDACIMEFGAENCSELIEAHRICMKGYGYEV